MRTSLEVADIFRSAGPRYRAAHAGHLSLAQLKVMTAIESCHTAALGGHIEACQDCGHWRLAYNSCRNRHCPKCQGAAARTWLAEREADLLPVGYFHVVFTLPAEIASIALQNKALVYDLLFKTASETMLTIAADPPAFQRHLALVRKKPWVVYAKPPFDENGVTFRVKDYRRDGVDRQRVMTLETHEFIRRFLTHVLPRGFHRIRHYGLLAGSARKTSLALARHLLDVVAPSEPQPDQAEDYRPPCPCCGSHMVIIEAFVRWRQPRAPPPLAFARMLAP